jgi:hypothetical protein
MGLKSIWEYNIKKGFKEYNGKLWTGLLQLRIFICCLFNDAVSSSDNIISKNDG